MSSTGSEAELIARITVLEQRKAALAAEQHEVILEFARLHVESQICAGDLEPEELERSIAAQIGLACGISPTQGRKRVRMARDLHAGHVQLRELFTAGTLSEQRTATVVDATSHLDPHERAEVDAQLAAQPITTLGVRRLGDLARTLAAAVAPEKFLARARGARTSRRVTIRPSADGMADLTAHLPVEQAAACYAALSAAVNDAAVSPEPLTRGRGQVMADTLVERITGQATARDVNIEIQVMVPVDALVDPGSPFPAQVSGHGPIPVDLLATSAGKKTWRRLVTRDGIVIGGDSRQRLFTGRLAALIRARDGHRCTEPYCDAPIREIDHIERWTDGGKTTFDNGRGLCAFHNHVRETRRWRVRIVGDTIVTTTPTGIEYASGTPRSRRSTPPRTGLASAPACLTAAKAPARSAK